jgi:hypothetical protein
VVAGFAGAVKGFAGAVKGFARAVKGFARAVEGSSRAVGRSGRVFILLWRAAEARGVAMEKPGLQIFESSRVESIRDAGTSPSRARHEAFRNETGVFVVHRIA